MATNSTSESDFLKQMKSHNDAMIALCRAYLLATPEGGFEEFAEETLDECAGDAALLEVWIEINDGQE